MEPFTATKLLQYSYCARPLLFAMQVRSFIPSILHTDSYCLSALKRSRDPAVLDTCDIVVDVGALYNEETLRFDHHQRGFTEVFGHGFETKLSSAGLIYKWAIHSTIYLLVHLHISNRHFGQDVIASHIKTSLGDPKVSTLWLKLYKVRDQFLVLNRHQLYILQ